MFENRAPRRPFPAGHRPSALAALLALAAGCVSSPSKGPARQPDPSEDSEDAAAPKPVAPGDAATARDAPANMASTRDASGDARGDTIPGESALVAMARRYLSESEKAAYSFRVSCLHWPQAIADRATGKFSAVEWKVRTIAAGRATFDEATAKECLRAWAAMDCRQFLRYQEPLACLRMMVGRANPGEFCGTSYDCRDEVCQLEDGGRARCTGRCVARPTLGQPCYTTPRCLDPYVCRGAGSNAVCMERPTEPKACPPDCGKCRYSSDCPFLLTCLKEPGAAEGVCGPARQVGERCEPRQDQCGFLEHCLPGPGGEYTCQVGSPIGSPCGLVDLNTGVHCLDDGYCAGAPGGNVPGVCQPRVANGGGCKDDIGSCQAGLRCVIGPYICEPERQLGQTCADRFACTRDLRCRRDANRVLRCQPPGELNEFCSDDSECSDVHRCVGGVCVSCR
jgi:hypothetical protein